MFTKVFLCADIAEYVEFQEELTRWFLRAGLHELNVKFFKYAATTDFLSVVVVYTAKKEIK